ncbi:DUF6049 family protein [Agromyces seonyuensis]|uniref:DUF6049 family protein n=1 Tax=Agromyces seonyuensis TaxID=2662446 RepID=UPI001F44AA7E|nr:DUF6049 family protein [Agromyces seonyuensis]
MLPESNRVRRLRRPDGAVPVRLRSRSPFAVPMRRFGSAALVAALGAGMLGGAMLADAALPALAATPSAVAEDGTVTLTVALASTSTIDATRAADPAAQAQLLVEIDNSTDRTIGVGSVRLFTAAGALDDDDELDAWLTADDSAPVGAELGRVETRVILPGDSATVALGVPISALDPGVDEVTPIGLGATFSTAGSSVADGRGTAVWSEGATGTVGLASVAALVAPATADGLISAEDLEELTASTGELSRQLDALADRSVAVGVDPRLIASILVLGDGAPESATAWLERLSGVSNETFPLQYADADLGLQARLELESPLQPLGFREATAASLLVDVPETESPTATPTPGASDSDAAPEPTSTATAEPTTDGDENGEDAAAFDPVAEALAGWPFSRVDVAWPADGTAIAGDAAFYSTAGLTTVIRSGDLGVEAGASAAATVEGGLSLLADAELSADYQEAAEATSDATYRAAAARAAARLAVLARSESTGGTVLAAVNREAAGSPSRLSMVLAETDALPWVRASTLAQAGAGDAPARALPEGSADDAHLATAATMLSAEDAVTEFATVLEDPAPLTDQQRRSLLGSFSNGVAAMPALWITATDDYLDSSRATVDAVSVVPAADVLVISSEVGVTVEVANELEYPATVEVSATPNNGRLIVEDVVELTVEANSRATARIPVAAGIGNGETRLTVRLESPTGVAVGSPVVIQANVHADWEGIGAVVLAIGAFGFLAFGVFRSIRRRRAERGAEHDDHGDGGDMPAMASSEQGGAASMPDKESSELHGDRDDDAHERPDTAGEPNEAPRG